MKSLGVPTGKHTLATDILVANDGNYQVNAGMVHLHNQGGTNVVVNGSMLYPDDMIEMGGDVETRLRIQFLGDYDFNQDISNYPCLRSGKKLVINRMLPKEEMCACEPYFRLVRSTTTVIDALSGINVNVAIGDPSGSSLIIESGSTIGEVTIPAGAEWAIITVAGRVIDGDQSNNATIAGSTWHVGRSEKWQASYDRTTNQYQKLPAITINGNGGRVFYSYAI